MAENKHNCIMCNTSYNICLNCPKLHSAEEYENFSMSEYIKKNNISEDMKSKMFLGFRAICCCAEHYFVYQIMRLLKRNEITPEKAKEDMLSLGYNIDNINIFNDSVKEYFMENIFKNENSMVIEPFEIYQEPVEVKENIEIRPNRQSNRRRRI